MDRHGMAILRTSFLEEPEVRVNSMIIFKENIKTFLRLNQHLDVVTEEVVNYVRSPSKLKFRLRSVGDILNSYLPSYEERTGSRRLPISRIRRLLTPSLRLYRPCSYKEFFRNSMCVSPNPWPMDHLVYDTTEPVPTLVLRNEHDRLQFIEKEFRSELRTSFATMEQDYQRSLELASDASFNPDFV